MANEITDVESLALISCLRELDVKQFAEVLEFALDYRDELSNGSTRDYDWVLNTQVCRSCLTITTENFINVCCVCDNKFCDSCSRSGDYDRVTGNYAYFCYDCNSSNESTDSDSEDGDDGSNSESD